jgi:hypothetical protein
MRWLRWLLPARKNLNNQNKTIEIDMLKTIKVSSLIVAFGAMVATVQAQTLLQSVNVAFQVYTQGATTVNPHNGNTNNIIDKSSYGTKDLIRDLTGSYTSDELLVRATPLTNSGITTNIAAISMTNVTITTTNFTNTSLFVGSVSNFIGTNAVTFGTNIENIDGTNVTIGSNYVTVEGTNFFIGTNTTVTTSAFSSNDLGTVSTTYTFTANALTTTESSAGRTGTPYYGIYNTHTKTLSTNLFASTNVSFSAATAHVYKDTNTLAYLHGETIQRDGVIHFATTDELRALFITTTSGKTAAVRGFAHGHAVAVSLGRDIAPASSFDYSWVANGSGTITNSTSTNIFIMDGVVTEQYFHLLQ